MTTATTKRFAGEWRDPLEGDLREDAAGHLCRYDCTPDDRRKGGPVAELWETVEGKWFCQRHGYVHPFEERFDTLEGVAGRDYGLAEMREALDASLRVDYHLMAHEPPSAERVKKAMGDHPEDADLADKLRVVTRDEGYGFTFYRGPGGYRGWLSDVAIQALGLAVAWRASRAGYAFGPSYWETQAYQHPEQGWHYHGLYNAYLEAICNPWNPQRASVYDQVAQRDGDADLLTLAEHVRQHLFTWALPADWGADFGITRNGKKWERVCTSSSEILAILEWEPRPDFDNGEEWDPAIDAYVKALWKNLGPFMRDCCEFTTRTYQP